MKKKSLTRLPSLPTIAVEILRVISNPDAPMQQIADLVQADPALASKILKAANSSRFGLPRRVADLRQALTLMGKAKVTPLVLSFSLASECVEDRAQAERFRRYWLRSFVQATAGEVLGGFYGPSVAAEAFTLNLLAGIGQLALLKQETADYIGCLERSQAEGTSLDDEERAVFGITHLELSLEMLEESRLPPRFISAVAALTAAGAETELEPAAAQLSQIVGTAEAFARYLCDNDRGVALVVLQERLGAGNGPALSLEELTTTVRQKLDDSAALFDIDPSVIPEPEDLLQNALEQLFEFTEMMNDLNSASVPAELVAENGRLKEQVQSLVIQTSTDSLTGVANRSYFDRRVEELSQHCFRKQIPFGLAAIDIDHFKEVNDTYGHLAGDCVLQQVAHTLQMGTRSNETLARYGGEEFVVLLEGVTEEGLLVIGERLRKMVESLQVEFEALTISVTISIGIASAIPTDSGYGATLFGIADAALYQAKQNGRNRVVVDCRHDENPVAAKNQITDDVSKISAN
ncbi:MAG: diguanylate cyclase [Fuerstiella sp.]